MATRIRLLLSIILLMGSEFSFSQNNAYPLTKALWHNNAENGPIVISVCWENPDRKYLHLMQLVKDAITDTWQRNSNIIFTYWKDAKDSDADIHIYIQDTIPHTRSLGAAIRHKPKGIVLNFDLLKWNPECGDKEYCIRTVAVHEFGHALGFAHEQNRPNCHFDNCLGKEDTVNGNWTIQPCDTFSVMNYCNPKYNNNGFLSALDKLALQSLYGLPDSLASKYQGLHLVYNSKIINSQAVDDEISHEMKVYISGSSNDLKSIDHVLYYLDPNWFSRRQRENIISNYETNFGIGLGLSGPVHLVAFVFIKNGEDDFEEKVLSEYLTFDH